MLFLLSFIFLWAKLSPKKVASVGFCSSALFSKVQHVIFFSGVGVIKIDACVSVVMPRAA